MLKQNTFGIHKIHNTTYAIQSRVKCPMDPCLEEYYLLNSHKPLYSCIDGIVERLFNSVCKLLRKKKCRKQNYVINSLKPLYRCIDCIVERLYNSVCMLLIMFM